MIAAPSTDLDANAPFPMTATARRRLSRLPVFSDRDYLKLYPDVAQAGFDGTTHALQHGLREGRDLYAEAALARAYGEAARNTAGPGHPADPPPDGSRPVSVFVHSLSDLPARDAAAALARDLRRAGTGVRLLDETADHLADHGAMVFVAPEDFFDLGRGALWWDPEILKRGTLCTTAPGETAEGRRSLAAVLNAQGVIEASAVWARIWAEAGVPTLDYAPGIALRSRWLEPADRLHPLVLAAPAAARPEWRMAPAWRERPIDLLFFGRDTERRSAFFGRHAASFAKHSGYLYLQKGAPDPVEERMHRRAHRRIFGHLAGRARLTLHLAEGRFPTLDRYGLVHQALPGGSVVVSDVALVDPDLRAGVHYFHEDSKHLAALIDWLLEDPDGHRAAEAAREAGFALVAAINGDGRRADRLAAFLAAPAAADEARP